MNILFIYDGHTSNVSLKNAVKQIEQDYGEAFEISIFKQAQLDHDEELYNQVLIQSQQAGFVFLVAHGGISYFKRFNHFMGQLPKGAKCFVHSGIQDEITEVMPMLNISASDYATIYMYYQMGGQVNYYHLILYLANTFSTGNYEVNEPLQPKWEGIYHPEKSPEAILKAVNATDKEVVAILFSRHNFDENNLAHINAMIAAVESKGVVALPVYTSIAREPLLGKKGIGWVIDNFLMQEGLPIIDSVINTIGYSMTTFNNEGKPDADDSVSVFESIQVPVVQAYSTFFTYEKWKESITGLDMMALVSGIYMPEMDGQIGGYPIACHKYNPDDGTFTSHPIPDRIDKVARLAINWAKLRNKAAEDKKVAIIFHNMPPRIDQIGGAAGLDSPATVLNIINKLKENGITTDYDFEKGDDIIYKIIEGVTNDSTWKSIEDMVADSIDTIDAATYQNWFDQLHPDVQEKMEKDWGKAPGDFLIHENKMPIPGILNGNVFIGLQPARAYEEKAEEVYHSTDFVCPHQYVAFYKWVKHIFEADFILHIGTHGTLEWLPGKEKGLSESCYPDITIDDMPHLYVYNISVVGEGIQAKRRSSAVLLDHCIPSMTESGTYHELSELDDLLKDYYQSVAGNPGKVPTLEEKIWELTVKLNLHQDLQLDETTKPADFREFVKDLHAWVEKIKVSVIKDGLHIFGQAPEGELYTNMLRLLVRIRNGEIMSINQGVAAYLGYDYNQILDYPDIDYKPGLTGHMLRDQFIQSAKTLVDGLQEHQYNITDYQSYISYHLDQPKGDASALIVTLKFVCDELKGRIDRLTDELEYALKGSNARFVSPGPGGCPTRGNALILPSGKNFYAIDPATIPSRASWDVGMRMGNDLLDRYLKDEGKYPESMAIILYAGDQMRTNGDCIAEILYLLGVRPVWLGNTNRVNTLEVIPLEELGRPRVDVTCRISGLFRDTFPNLIEMIDDAIHLVATLDEPLDQNNIKKHFVEEVEELTAKGMDKEVAEQESLLRVFGCPPGTYGGGVDILISSGKWETNEDLADVSVNWSSHAYSRRKHGEKRPDIYTRRLSKTDVTVKNEVSVEFDIYEIDDEYVYHGGLLAAVKKHSGKAPRSYYGNSSDPDRTSIADLREETARIVRARMLNPKWIDGLKRHGFKGANDIAFNMDNVFGWDATGDLVEDWMYEEITNHLLFNKENKDWMDEVNPYATHHIVEQLLETIQRGMWHAKDETLERLQQIYLACEGNLEGANYKQGSSH